MPVYALDSVSPIFDDLATTWIAPDATIIGNVHVGADVGLWFGVVIRGDNDRITIGARTNVQEHTIMHTDPGYALTTGKCSDVGKITRQSMRGLAARAPYFANGSAADLRTVVDYYDRRYNIGYTPQESEDLVNLMSAL